jgi:hypothetical protein
MHPSPELVEAALQTLLAGEWELEEVSRALEKCTTRAERLCTTMGFTGETAAVARTAEVEDEV